MSNSVAESLTEVPAGQGTYVDDAAPANAAQTFELPDLSEFADVGSKSNQITIVIGHATIDAERAARLAIGDVIMLDCHADDPVEIHVNGRLVARGELVVMNDELCVRVIERLSESDQCHACKMQSDTELSA